MKISTQHIFLVSILLLSGCTSNADELLIEAENLENQGKFKEAIPILDKAIKLNPQLLGAYINRGADYSALGNYEKAIENYMIVLEKDRYNQLALFNIAKNYERLNKQIEAVKYYSEILNDNNGNPKPELFTTDESGNIGEFQIRFYEVAYERGLVYYELENWDAAFKDFQFCINNNYMTAPSRYMCGAVYEIYGKYDNACNEYKIAASMGDQDALKAKNELCK